ncbi:MAG TPA: uracil phosphoribosyltransferase [Methanobacteriaceae archaeon]|nr:uracil phosphoribosyltransferase [Methanobacteriaceae archaeon]
MIEEVDHLLLQEKLSQIRRIGIGRVEFRDGIREIGRLISYNFADSLEKEIIEVTTPMGTAKGVKIIGRDDIIVVSVLRAAIPMVEGIMRVFQEAQSGVAGAWRSDKPPFPVEVGYLRLPEVNDKIVIVADPMLATGNTMVAILDRIKEMGAPKRLVLFNIIAAQEGLEKVLGEHPDVEIYTASVEKELTKEGYIVPGLGDAGDKCFGKPYQ